jgi:hypothetical protein
MNQNSITEQQYIIPQKFRIIENLHIVFWLIKDMSWCIVSKPLGIGMFIPTIAIAIYIMWQNRTIVSELYHNLAVMFWILANGYWMISEFFEFDEHKITNLISWKHVAVIPFALGLICLIIYYGFIMPKENKKNN